MVYHNTAPRAVMERLNLYPLKRVTQQSGKPNLLYFPLYDADGRAYQSVANLIYISRDSSDQIERIDSGFSGEETLWRMEGNEIYRNLTVSLMGISFNRAYFSTLATHKHLPSSFTEKALLPSPHQNLHHKKVLNYRLMHRFDTHISAPFCEILHYKD